VNAGDHKQRFDTLKPNDATQADFLSDCLDAYEIVHDGEIDMDEVLDRIKVEVASQSELAAYRGAKEALEEHHD
jgi:hypothetical protein